MPFLADRSFRKYQRQLGLYQYCFLRMGAQACTWLAPLWVALRTTRGAELGCMMLMLMGRQVKEEGEGGQVNISTSELPSMTSVPLWHLKRKTWNKSRLFSVLRPIETERDARVRTVKKRWGKWGDIQVAYLEEAVCWTSICWTNLTLQLN